MIKKTSKIVVALLSAGLMVGCASKSDLNQLKGRVDDLDKSLAAVKATADSADAAAKRAAASSDEVNAKLDRMFKHSMRK